MKRVVGSTGSSLLPSPEEAKLRVFQDVSNSIISKTLWCAKSTQFFLKRECETTSHDQLGSQPWVINSRHTQSVTLKMATNLHNEINVVVVDLTGH